MASDQSSLIAQCIASGSNAPADESLALAVAVFAFVGAGMWMFHRFGRRSGSAPAAQGAGVPALAPATA